MQAKRNLLRAAATKKSLWPAALALVVLLLVTAACGPSAGEKTGPAAPPEQAKSASGNAAESLKPENPPEPEPVSGELVALIADKVVKAEAAGDSIEFVEVRLRSLVDRTVEVKIPPGTFFVASSSSVQNMVATEETTVTLQDDDWHSARVPAACANMRRDIPGEGDSFQIKPSPAKKDLEKLAPFLAQEDYPVRQAAVWIVTDNADYDDLGILVESSLQGLGGTRVINEDEAARAMRLLSEAGINVKSKRIWQDRQKILRGVKDPDLKAWLAGQR